MPQKGVMVDHSILTNEKRILSLNQSNLKTTPYQSRSNIGHALMSQGVCETEKGNKPISLLGQGVASFNVL